MARGSLEEIFRPTQCTHQIPKLHDTINLYCSVLLTILDLKTSKAESNVKTNEKIKLTTQHLVVRHHHNFRTNRWYIFRNYYSPVLRSVCHNQDVPYAYALSPVQHAILRTTHTNPLFVLMKSP